MREPEVTQAADIQDRHSRLDRRLSIRGVKRAGFSRVLVSPQRNLEGILDIGHVTGDIQQHAIDMGAGYCEVVRFGKSNDGLVIRFCGAEPGVELIRGEILPVVGAGRVTDVLQKAVEALRVAQGQADGQIQGIR